MKTLIYALVIIVVLCVSVVTVNSAFAQNSVQTTTTSMTTSRGTVSELTPNAIILKIDSSSTPVRYAFTKTTTYVDENGNPVSVETVKTGLPVTVYYDQDGDRFTATKVVVKKTISTTDSVAPVIQESGSPSVNGFINDADSEDISIRSNISSGPSHYKAKESTAYVDENGNPVSRSSVKAGTPVTVFFERDGENLVATRVIVKSSVSIQPTTQILEEKKTTTSTEQ